MLPGLPRAYQHTLCRAWLCRAMHVRVVGEAPVGQPESAAAHWLPGASPRVTHSAPMAWALRARAPVAAGSLPRATRSAPKAGALRARAPTCAPRVTAHVVSWGGVGMSKTSCAARCSRGSRCKACFELLPRARVGWHTARTLLPPPPPRSSGAPVRWLMARGRRASGARAPRSRAAGAPWEARARAARVQTAGEDLVVVGGGGGSNSELPQMVSK